MHRLALLLSAFLAICASAQNPPSSDPFAISLAQQAVAALTGGAAVSDVTLNANVVSSLGPESETGTGTFSKAKGISENLVDLSLNTTVTYVPSPTS